MEGGLKESEESFRITILLHSAHPPRSSLSPSLSTTSKHRQSHRRSHRQNLRYSRGHVSQTKQNKKKAKGNSFACVFGRPVCGCSSPVEHFTLLLLLKCQIIVTYFSYLLWLRSVVVLFRLYSIFLSHFKPFPSSFFIDEHDSYPCFLLPVAVIFLHD